MKKKYIAMAIFFGLYFVTIVFEYNEDKTLYLNDKAYEVVPAVKFEASLDPSRYVYQNSSWEVVSQKKPIVKKEVLTIKEQAPIKVDMTTFPIRICEDKDCYEFIAFKNDFIILYGKKLDNSIGFINASVGDQLNYRISIKNKSNKNIEFYDNEMNQTVSINLFDINVSMYKPKEDMENINDKN